MRTWLAANGYVPSVSGRLSGEMRDIYTAVTEGYLPKGESNAVQYVNLVRRWMMDTGNGIERIAPIPGNWFSKYNREFDLEDTTEEVIASMDQPAEDDEIPSVTFFPIEPLSLADLKAMEAAEAEAHQVNRERYSGTAKVTLAMNRSFANVISTAVFEAHTMIDGAFSEDGSPRDSTYRDLKEAMGCLKQAAVLLENLLVSFHPEVDIEVNIAAETEPPERYDVVGKRVILLDDGFSGGIVLGYDAGNDTYRVALDYGSRAGTTHFLERYEFKISD